MLYNTIKVGDCMKDEVRTFIPDERTEEVIAYFDNNSSKKELEKQIIYNYHTEGELRLIRTNNYIQLDFKSNQENNKVYIGKKYEKDLINLFRNIGISVEFKRFRERYKYMVDDIYFTVDKNVKTGNILRAKINYQTEEEKQIKLEKVHKILNEINLEESTFAHFEEMYGKYRTSWYDLTKDINEDEFLK